MNAVVDMNKYTAQPQASLAAALAKANTEMHNPIFDKTNPHFRSKFASLAAVRNAVVPTYAKHGLSILQDLQSTETGVACYTTILHASGEEKTLGPLVIPVTKQDAQGYASAGTYAKRVHLQAVACVVGDEDDDAEAAVGRPGVHSPKGDDLKPQPAELVQKYVDRFRAAMDNPDEDAGAVDVFAIHNEVSANHDLYIAIGEALGSKYKNAIRKFVEIAKKKGVK